MIEKLFTALRRAERAFNEIPNQQLDEGETAGVAGLIGRTLEECRGLTHHIDLYACIHSIERAAQDNDWYELNGAALGSGGIDVMDQNFQCAARFVCWINQHVEFGDYPGVFPYDMQDAFGGTVHHLTGGEISKIKELPPETIAKELGLPLKK